jgi:hypothetical protein
MKHLVTSGCSFTNLVKPNIDMPTEYPLFDKNMESWTWVEWIQYYESDNYKVHNYGCPTNDNSTIVESVMYAISKLMKDGINPTDIEVIIQWSALSRNSFYIPKYMVSRSEMTNRIHTNDFISEKRYPYEHGFKYLTGGYNRTDNLDKLNDITFNYFAHQYSNEERIISWLKNIIMMSSFCKSLGIKYKYFQMNNNITSNSFSTYDNLNNRTQEPVIDFGPNLLKYKLVGENWEAGMFMDNPYINYLIDLIDFENDFWYYQIDGYHKCGGALEWTLGNWDENIVDDSGLNLSKNIYFEMEFMSDTDIKNYFNDKSYGHPSTLMWRKFYFDILKPKFL